MSKKFFDSERISFISFAIFVLSFWIFLFAKLMTFIGIMRYSVAMNNVEFFAFITMIPSLGLFLRILFKLRNDSETVLKQKTEQLQLRLSAIDSTNAVIEFTPKGHILSINKTFTDVFGYGEEIVEKHHSMLVPERISKSIGYNQLS